MKAPKFRILVHPSYLSTPWAEQLQAQGHTVVAIEYGECEPDLILAPSASRFLDGMEQFLPLILKQVIRLRQKGKG